MFRCKECGSEYKEKPDYCDCGNDTFEEIAETIEQTAEPQKSASPVINQSTVNIKNPEKRDYNQFSSNNISKGNNKADILSLGLFILSIILAVCTLFVFGNPKEQPSKPTEQAQTVQDEKTANIPNVDSYWDNSTAGIISDKAQEENIVVSTPPAEPQNTQTAEQHQETSTPMSKFEQWLNKPKRVVEDTPRYVAQKPQTTSTTVSQKPKTTVAKQPTTTQQKQPTSVSNAKINSPGAPNDLLNRIQNNIQFTNTNKVTQKPTTYTNQTKPSTQTAIPAQTATQATGQKQLPKITTQATQPATTQTPPTLRNATHQQVKSSAELRQEVASYKASLRNTIGKKINFANVIGDGNCALTFKVDSSGKLINRNFATQSSNITLNDAVYKAMMSTPSYNPPPEGYKSETMTLRVKIYDGNYEITLN